MKSQRSLLEVIHRREKCCITRTVSSFLEVTMRSRQRNPKESSRETRLPVVTRKIRNLTTGYSWKANEITYETLFERELTGDPRLILNLKVLHGCFWRTIIWMTLIYSWLYSWQFLALMSSR